MLRGFTGFGFGLASVPLASLALPPSLVVAAALLMQAAIGLRDCFAERRVVKWPAVLRLALGCIAGTPLGFLALAWLPQPVMRLVLGAMVLVALAVTLRPMPHRGPPGPAWGLLAGGIAGVCSGLAAMPGPPSIVYFLVFEPDRRVMRASLMAFFPLSALVALPAAAVTGLLTRDALLLAVIGLPIMLAGGWLGAALFRRAGHRSYRRAATAALALTASLSIARGLSGLL